eukprot:6459826-Amphidinium_carterae.1
MEDHPKLFAISSMYGVPFPGDGCSDGFRLFRDGSHSSNRPGWLVWMAICTVVKNVHALDASFSGLPKEMPEQ